MDYFLNALPKSLVAYGKLTRVACDIRGSISCPTLTIGSVMYSPVTVDDTSPVSTMQTDQQAIQPTIYSIVIGQGPKKIQA